MIRILSKLKQVCISSTKKSEIFLVTKKMVNLWGPSDDVPKNLQFDGFAYAPFSKGDKLGKVADWAADPAKEAKDQKRAQGRGFRDPYYAYGASGSSFFAGEETESPASFSIVESINSRIQPFYPKNQNNTYRAAVFRSRRNQTPANANKPGAPVATPAQPVPRSQPMSRGPRTMTIGSATNHNRRGGRQQPWQQDKMKSRKPSVIIDNDWKLVQTNNFSELQKLHYHVNESKVLGEYGSVQVFDKRMDKLLGAQKLKRADVTEYNVSTSEDPVIRSIVESNTGKPGTPKVYATDAIVALLMCATKSYVPWDIIVTKKDGNIFFDKRDNSAIDRPAVDENSKTPPQDVADLKINSASELALEESYINLNFTAGVIMNGKENEYSFPKPNPFSSGDEPENAPLLPKGYIYKEFNLEIEPEKEPIPLVLRMDIDAAVDRQGEKELANVHALLEYGGSKPLVWKDRFADHSGAIISEEMKNNLNKLSQWTCRALLAGSQAIKIGFVSRASAKDEKNHQIISVVTHNPSQFAKQLNFNESMGWGIIKSLVNVFSELDDGKFVILREPNQQAVSIYEVPSDAVIEASS